MTLRENRFLLGILFPILYEIGLIQAYLFFVARKFELFLLLPILLFIFPAYFIYIFSPYIILYLTRATEKYSDSIIKNIDEIFLLNEIDLNQDTKKLLKKNIYTDILPDLLQVFKRGYIDTYFTRNEDIRNERMLSLSESLFLLAITFSIINIINLFVTIYLHFYSIDLDFLYIDRIVNPLNVIFFGFLFGFFILLSFSLYLHSRRNLIALINITSFNLASFFDESNLKVKTRQVELDTVRKFPLESKIGRKLSSNRDFVKKLYYDFIQSNIKEELHEYSKKEVARTLVLDQYSELLDKLNLPKEKRRELELQFYLGQRITGAIDDIVASEEETESIKLDMLYSTKKLESWDEISSDEQISTFLFTWRSIETLFRYILWKRKVYPQDDQSWPSIVDCLLREKILTIQENKTLKRIRQRRNAMLHRSQDRFVSKEDLEGLLEILQHVLDKS